MTNLAGNGGFQSEQNGQGERPNDFFKRSKSRNGGGYSEVVGFHILSYGNSDAGEALGGRLDVVGDGNFRQGLRAFYG